MDAQTEPEPAQEGSITESGFREFINRKGFTVAGISYEDYEKAFDEFLFSKGATLTDDDYGLGVKVFVMGRLLHGENFTPEAIQNLHTNFISAIQSKEAA